jgi:hemoglobin-like flavoprotein
MTDKIQPKQYKSNWFRVAVAGDTTDGREIQPEWIIQMAESYNPNTYGARVNVEHIRSAFPDSSFGAYGDVLAVKTEKVEIDGEQKDALFVQIKPNANLIELNKRGQKVYSSIEVDRNFAKTGKAYLVGLAVTDSPASLGTEMLQFASTAKVNPLADRKQNPDNIFTASQEVSLEFEEVKEQKSFTGDLVEKVKNLFKKTEQQQQQNQQSFSENEQAIMAIAEQTASQGEAHSQLLEKHNQLEAEFKDFKSKLDKEPQFTSRPESNDSQYKETVDY